MRPMDPVYNLSRINWASFRTFKEYKIETGWGLEGTEFWLGSNKLAQEVDMMRGSHGSLEQVYSRPGVLHLAD